MNAKNPSKKSLPVMALNEAKQAIHAYQRVLDHLETNSPGPSQGQSIADKRAAADIAIGQLAQAETALEEELAATKLRLSELTNEMRALGATVQSSIVEFDKQQEQLQTDATAKTGASAWNGGLYWNQHDDRFFVPKRIPWFGWTINLAHPYAEPALMAVIVLPALLAAAACAKSR